MKKFLTIPAYFWAVICMLLIPVTFIGSSNFAKNLAKLPFMKVHPAFTGGETDRTYVSDSLTVTVNKPVFPALFGEGKRGFVQVRFSGKVPLPAVIEETIDFDNDNSSDFSLKISTKTGETTLQPLNGKVRNSFVSTRVKEDWVVRVDLIQ
jgi:hypothetical protein